MMCCNWNSKTNCNNT